MMDFKMRKMGIWVDEVLLECWCDNKKASPTGFEPVRVTPTDF